MSDWFEEGAAAGAVDMSALWDSRAADLLWSIAAAGALVSVGTTSDGGACSVTVTLDGRWRRVYVRESEELIDWLEGALAAVGAAPRRLDASPGRRRRARGS